MGLGWGGGVGVEGWGGGGMWSRYLFSPACLEPTRTGVGSPGAKIESEVGVRRHEPEVRRKGEIARRECERMVSGADQKGTGNGGTELVRGRSWRVGEMTGARGLECDMVGVGVCTKTRDNNGVGEQ